MRLRTLAVIFGCGFACSATAGLFDSNTDEEKAPFKCGRDDAISALIDTMKDEASTRFTSMYGIPNTSEKKEQYRAKIITLPVTISGVSTTSGTGNSLSCVAKIKLALPDELNELANKTPRVYSDFIARSNAIEKDDELIWKNIRYSIMLADNAKDISVQGNDISIPMDSLAKSAMLAVDKDDILKLYDPVNIDLAKSDYTVVDKELNKIWKAIPPSFRTSMKYSQVDWIYQKEAKCGTIQQADSDSYDVPSRVKIFQCQTTMTQERIKYLGGGKYK